MGRTELEGVDCFGGDAGGELLAGELGCQCHVDGFGIDDRSLGGRETLEDWKAIGGM